MIHRRFTRSRAQSISPICSNSRAPQMQANNSDLRNLQDRKLHRRAKSLSPYWPTRVDLNFRDTTNVNGENEQTLSEDFNTDTKLETVESECYKLGHVINTECRDDSQHATSLKQSQESIQFTQEQCGRKERSQSISPNLSSTKGPQMKASTSDHRRALDRKLSRRAKSLSPCWPMAVVHSTKGTPDGSTESKRSLSRQQHTSSVPRKMEKHMSYKEDGGPQTKCLTNSEESTLFTKGKRCRVERFVRSCSISPARPSSKATPMSAKNCDQRQKRQSRNLHRRAKSLSPYWAVAIVPDISRTSKASDKREHHSKEINTGPVLRGSGESKCQHVKKESWDDSHQAKSLTQSQEAKLFRKEKCCRKDKRFTRSHNISPTLSSSGVPQMRASPSNQRQERLGSKHHRRAKSLSPQRSVAVKPNVYTANKSEIEELLSEDLNRGPVLNQIIKASSKSDNVPTYPSTKASTPPQNAFINTSVANQACLKSPPLRRSARLQSPPPSVTLRDSDVVQPSCSETNLPNTALCCNGENEHREAPSSYNLRRVKSPTPPQCSVSEMAVTVTDICIKTEPIYEGYDNPPTESSLCGLHSGVEATAETKDKNKTSGETKIISNENFNGTRRRRRNNRWTKKKQIKRENFTEANSVDFNASKLDAFEPDSSQNDSIAAEKGAVGQKTRKDFVVNPKHQTFKPLSMDKTHTDDIQVTETMQTCKAEPVGAYDDSLLTQSSLSTQPQETVTSLDDQCSNYEHGKLKRKKSKEKRWNRKKGTKHLGTCPQDQNIQEESTLVSGLSEQNQIAGLKVNGLVSPKTRQSQEPIPFSGETVNTDKENKAIDIQSVCNKENAPIQKKESPSKVMHKRAALTKKNREYVQQISDHTPKSESISLAGDKVAIRKNNIKIKTKEKDMLDMLEEFDKENTKITSYVKDGSRLTRSMKKEILDTTDFGQNQSSPNEHTMSEPESPANLDSKNTCPALKNPQKEIKSQHGILENGVSQDLSLSATMQMGTRRSLRKKNIPKAADETLELDNPNESASPVVKCEKCEEKTDAQGQRASETVSQALPSTCGSPSFVSGLRIKKAWSPTYKCLLQSPPSSSLAPPKITSSYPPSTIHNEDKMDTSCEEANGNSLYISSQTPEQKTEKESERCLLPIGLRIKKAWYPARHSQKAGLAAPSQEVNKLTSTHVSNEHNLVGESPRSSTHCKSVSFEKTDEEMADHCEKSDDLPPDVSDQAITETSSDVMHCSGAGKAEAGEKPKDLSSVQSKATQNKQGTQSRGIKRDMKYLKKNQFNEATKRNELRKANQVATGEVAKQPAPSEPDTNEETSKNDPSESTAIEFMKKELEMLSLNLAIKESLSKDKPNHDLCVKLMDDLLKLRVAPLMLKKYPDLVITLTKITHYTDTKVVSMAEKVLNNLKVLFLLPQDKSFLQEFEKQVEEYHKDYASISGAGTTREDLAWQLLDYENYQRNKALPKEEESTAHDESKDETTGIEDYATVDDMENLLLSAGDEASGIESETVVPCEGDMNRTQEDLCDPEEAVVPKRSADETSDDGKQEDGEGIVPVWKDSNKERIPLSPNITGETKITRKSLLHSPNQATGNISLLQTNEQTTTPEPEMVSSSQQECPKDSSEEKTDSQSSGCSSVSSKTLMNSVYKSFSNVITKPKNKRAKKDNKRRKNSLGGKS